MRAAFTPGPWASIVEKDGSVVVYEATTLQNIDICTMGGNNNDGSNARLIAAAPELLALLKECREFFDNCQAYDGADTNNLDTRCMDAIAAATGEQA